MSGSEVLPVAGMPVERASMLGNFARRQHNRLHFLDMLLGTIGLGKTAKVVFGKKAMGMAEVPLRLEHPDLNFPIDCTDKDVGTFNEVLFQRVWEYSGGNGRELNGLAVVDAGASEGTSTTYLASRYPDSTIFAIEPNGRNYDYLEKNARPYGSRVHTVKAALAAEAGSIGLVNEEALTFGAHNCYLYSNDFFRVGHPNVFAPAITPSGIIDLVGRGNRVGIFKADIEGAEIGFFRSQAAKPLLDLVDVLMIETHDQWHPGCSLAVERAASASGLKSYSQEGHTTIYTRLAD
ncbi:TPA: hypothetical protein DIS56_00290 [Candidatus Saccharibacteria bacterium]|nr:MAG: hypothetical protein UX30_C0002G0051 [Candidatus Saccharibacteria bacterium GW2011_GWA2_46_10]HCM51567.1 hypothetical protein [Candidatus Saccharibacteria bacterium]